ncbi:MAG: pseudouridine-5'-phosphate glycosidase [Planctomycetota bacterium]|jgi:pseudouridine-5'-phosphate glycosidase
MNWLTNRAESPSLALETTLLCHGVPEGEGIPLARRLGEIVRECGANPAVVGVLGGRAIVGMDDGELESMLAMERVEKANTSNLGALVHAGVAAATTVSATMEISALAGVRVFATGGIGGVHRGYGDHFDVSADLTALSRFPVAVISSGVKSLLDVRATREALETLGVTVVGFGTDEFPAFYLRRGNAGRVDRRIDDVEELADFVRFELERTGRGLMVANPVPEEDEVPIGQWSEWMEQAKRGVSMHEGCGRDVTPRMLAELHRVSGGETLRTNIALVESNTLLGARLACAMGA